MPSSTAPFSIVTSSSTPVAHPQGRSGRLFASRSLTRCSPRRCSSKNSIGCVSFTRIMPGQQGGVVSGTHAQAASAGRGAPAVDSAAACSVRASFPVQRRASLLRARCCTSGRDGEPEESSDLVSTVEEVPEVPEVPEEVPKPMRASRRSVLTGAPAVRRCKL